MLECVDNTNLDHLKPKDSLDINKQLLSNFWQTL